MGTMGSARLCTQHPLSQWAEPDYPPSRVSWLSGAVAPGTMCTQPTARTMGSQRARIREQPKMPKSAMMHLAQPAPEIQQHRLSQKGSKHTFARCSAPIILEARAESIRKTSMLQGLTDSIRKTSIRETACERPASAKAEHVRDQHPQRPSTQHVLAQHTADSILLGGFSHFVPILGQQALLAPGSLGTWLRLLAAPPFTSQARDRKAAGSVH